MNQYEIQNAGRAIDGYYIPRPNESKTETFNRAKEEAVRHMQNSLESVRTLTFEQFDAAGFQKY